MNAVATFPFRVGGVTVDPARRHVSGPGGDIALEPLVMQLLLQLVGRPGEVFERRELFDRLWGKAQVGDDSLNRLVGGLRKVLERTSAGTVHIETVPRVGYRLIAEPETEVRDSPITRRSVVAGAGALVATIGGASLYRANTDRRAQVAGLTSDGDRLLFDAVPLQAGVALPTLQRALDLDPGDARALGLTALAEETRANSGGSIDAGGSLRRAEGAARAALERDRLEPHARLALLDLKANSLTWAQMEDGLDALRRSAPGNPHVLGALASFLQAAGRTSRSWTLNEQTAAAAPASPTPQWRRVLRLWTADRTEDALHLSERLLPLWPGHALVWNARFMVLAFSGRTEAAASMLRQSAATLGNAHPAKADQWLPTLAAFADPAPARIAAATTANLTAARLNPGQATYAAMTLAQLGEVDAAFAVIDGLLLSAGSVVADRPVVPRSFAANAPSWCRTQWLFMPPLASVRADRRFATLCDRLGLTRYWNERGVGPDTQIPSVS